MTRVTFSKIKTPLKILVNEIEVGTIERNYIKSHVMVSFSRIQWDNSGVKPKAKIGGQSCIWVKHVTDAKQIALVVATAYAPRLLGNKPESLASTILPKNIQANWTRAMLNTEYLGVD